MNNPNDDRNYNFCRRCVPASYFLLSKPIGDGFSLGEQ